MAFRIAEGTRVQAIDENGHGESARVLKVFLEAALVSFNGYETEHDKSQAEVEDQGPCGLPRNRWDGLFTHCALPDVFFISYTGYAWTEIKFAWVASLAASNMHVDISATFVLLSVHLGPASGPNLAGDRAFRVSDLADSCLFPCFRYLDGIAQYVTWCAW